MHTRIVDYLAASALILGLCAGCDKNEPPAGAKAPPSAAPSSAASSAAAPLPSSAASSAAAPLPSATPSTSKLKVRWKAKRSKTGVDLLLVAGSEVVTVGPLGIEDDSGHEQTPKVTAASPQRSEIAGPIEGAPWYSATLKDGALVVERQDPEGKSTSVARVATTATSLDVKPFRMPSRTPPACDKGFFRGNDGECLKECSADADCAKDEVCEQVHDFSEGRIGPVLGSGCTKN